MRPEHRDLARQGMEMVVAHHRGDLTGRDLLVERFVARRGPARLTEALAYATIVAVERAAAAQRTTFAAAMSAVDTHGVTLLPGDTLCERDVRRLAASRNSGTIMALIANMDPCTAVNATFRLAVNACETLTNIPYGAPAPSDPYLPPRPIEATHRNVERPGWVR